jgi:hypothetical protein
VRGGAACGFAWRAQEYAGISGVSYANTAAALVHIARTERLPGLFSGLGSTILRDAPFSGLYLLMYTRLKRVVEESKLLPPATPPYAAPPAPPTLYVEF